MDYNNLAEFIHYDTFFMFETKEFFHKHIMKMVGVYSNDVIDVLKIKYDLNYVYQCEGKSGYVDTIIPLNEYTEMMLYMDKKSILRYHKIKRLLDDNKKIK